MLGKMEPIRRTPYLDDCMKMLIKENESDLDGLLVTHVKCHLLMDQITLCLSNRAQGSQASEGIPSYLIRASEAQLPELRTSLPPDLHQNSEPSLVERPLGVKANQHRGRVPLPCSRRSRRQVRAPPHRRQPKHQQHPQPRETPEPGVHRHSPPELAPPLP